MDIFQFSDSDYLKIASAQSLNSLKDLKDTLQVGDIVYTKPRHIDDLFHKAFYKIESAIQGSPYTHVGIYIGDNKIVDSGEYSKGDKAGFGVHSTNIAKYTDNYDFKVLRVNASDKVKQEAASYAKNQIGKGFNTSGMLRVILPFQGEAKKDDRVQAPSQESFFCSELVANAYSPVNIASKKSLRHIKPGDIYKSKLVKPIAEFSKSAAVATHQQETEWTCSAACLKAALKHIGYDLPENDLAAAIGVRKNKGAETTDIVKGAKHLGFEAWEQSFHTLEAVKEVLRQEIPIIADIQSFNHPGKGHYVLLAGFDQDGFLMMDPNTKDKTAIPNWRKISPDKLDEIWWDRAMAPPHEYMPRWGVMVMEPLSKEAGMLTTALVDEMIKIGADPETIKAMITGAKALGLIGAGLGFIKGSDPGPEGDEPSGPIAGAAMGGIKGAIIGAIIALGIQRNGVGLSTLPNLFK